MGLIAENLSREPQNPGAPVDDLIDWRQRYDGVLVVAYLDGKAVAGISGPWPVSQYALTWWDRPVPARQLELFDSMEAAQKRVEEWAWRMRTVGLIGRSPANDPIEPDSEVISVARPSWLARIGGWFGGGKPARVRRMPRMEFEALRNPPLNEDALRGIHFAAIE
jgi:hypothetical protein